MECRDMTRLIDSRLDHQLSGVDVREFDAHVASCERCRREYGGLLTLLTRPAPIEVPPGLRDRIVASLERQQAPVLKLVGGGQVQRSPWIGVLRTAVGLAACVALFASGWMLSGWWTASHLPQPGAALVASKTPEPATVVISPWMMSSWAQAMAMPGPTSPAVMLVQGMVPEMMIVPPQVEEPSIRVYRRSAPAQSTQPADTVAPELRIVPLAPRHLGA